LEPKHVNNFWNHIFVTQGASDDGVQCGTKQANKSRKKKAPTIEGNKVNVNVHTKQVA
jgi:hypothetical protein